MSDTIEVSETKEKKYRCPGCYYTGVPTYLKKVPPDPQKRRDYSEVPICPRCLNEFLWRNATQMREE